MKNYNKLKKIPSSVHVLKIFTERVLYNIRKSCEGNTFTYYSYVSRIFTEHIHKTLLMINL